MKVENSKATYLTMVVEAVANLDERLGSSLQAIRKYILANFLVRKQQAASFNSLTLKAASKAVELKELEKIKNSYKLTFLEKERRKKKARIDSGEIFGRENEGGRRGGSLIGTAAENNKVLRNALLGIKRKRDEYLMKELDILLPFLPEQHHFLKANNRQTLQAIKEEQKSTLNTTANRKVTDAIVPAPQLLLQDRDMTKGGMEHSERVEVTSSAVPVPVSTAILHDSAMIDSPSSETISYSTATTSGASSSAVTTASTLLLPRHDTASLVTPAVQAVVHAEATVALDPTEAPFSEITRGLDRMDAEATGTLQTVAEICLAKVTVGTESEGTAHLERTVERDTVHSEATVGREEEEAHGSAGPVAPDTAGGVLSEPTVGPNTSGGAGEALSDWKLVRAVCATGEDALKSEADLLSTSFEMPSELRATLHPHQVEGIRWMAGRFDHGLPMILGDQMGLGKTVQAIGLLAYLKFVRGLGGPFLVVVPLSVLSNWLSEINRFCPMLQAVRLHGPKPERDRVKSEELRDLNDFDVVVTTYEVVVSECRFLRRKFVWTAIIVDEGHRLKNERSQFSDKIRLLPTLGRVILTGTPLQNNLRELWAMLHFLLPDVFTLESAEKFEFGFDLLKSRIDSGILRKARRLLGLFMLRRIKEQVSVVLPPKKEFTVMVPLTPAQVAYYKQLLSGMDRDAVEVVMGEAEASGRGEEVTGVDDKQIDGCEVKAATSTAPVSSDGTWRKLMNLLLQLRKLCNHLYLMPDAAPEPYEISEELVEGSGKLKLLDRMLPRLQQDGHRVLLFSQFTMTLDLLEDYCELRGWPFARLDGSTNRVQRRLDLRRFNAPNSPLFLFLISTRAGGLGLNLASADTVILYDSDWNPQVDLQAMERAHRIGQTKPVTVYRLVSRGSVEERMIARASKKLYLNAMVGERETEGEERGRAREGERAEGGVDEEGLRLLRELGADENDVEEDNEFASASLSSRGARNGISAAGLSKSEVASLIRYGANAVLDSGTDSAAEFTDEELDKLMGRIVSSSNGAVASDTSLNPNANGAERASMTEDELQRQQVEILLSRMNPLAEVDLRSFQNVSYEKKKKASARTWSSIHSSEEIVDTKRNRKERVVMVDGRGSGYGGEIPVLSAFLVDNEQDTAGPPTAAEKSLRKRVRDWVHLDFCALCGGRPPPLKSIKKKGRSKSKAKGKIVPDLGPVIECSYCPLVFHEKCMNDAGIQKSTSVFSCPQHRCASCSRTTASAGGLLFRCTDCLTAYCEDCLPQEDVDGQGTSELFSGVNYTSKQAYFVLCPNCKYLNDPQINPNSTAEGDSYGGGTEMADSMDVEEVERTLSTVGSAVDENGHGKEPVDNNTEKENGDDGASSVASLLPTQHLRIHHKAIDELESSDESESKAKRRGRGKSSSGSAERMDDAGGEGSTRTGLREEGHRRSSRLSAGSHPVEFMML